MADRCLTRGSGRPVTPIADTSQTLVCEIVAREQTVRRARPKLLYEDMMLLPFYAGEEPLRNSLHEATDEPILNSRIALVRVAEKAAYLDD